MQNAQRQVQSIGKKFTRAGKALSIGLTLPILAFGAKATLAFDKQAQAIAQVEAGLKSTGNVAGKTLSELQAQASALQEKTLFGDEEILEGATAQLLTFTNIANEQFDKTQRAALDLAARLKIDLKSASIQLGKALNDPVANLSALSRSGIQFSKEQKSTIKTLVETNRLAQAQDIILEELQRQYGGAAAAAAKAGKGAFKQLGNSIGDLTEDFGQIITKGLIPTAERIKKLVARLQGLDDGTKRTIVIVGGLLAVLGPLLTTIGFIATNVVPGLIRSFAALRKTVVALNAVMVTNPYTAIAAVVGTLAASYLLLRNRTRDAADSLSLYDRISETAQKSIAGEKAKLEELLFIARDEYLSKERRIKAVEELNKLSPKYLGDLTLEKINTDAARVAIDKYNQALLKTAKVKAAQEKLQEIQSKIIEAEIGGSKARKKLLDDELFNARLREEAIQRGITLEQRRKEFFDATSGVLVSALKREAEALLEIIRNNDDLNVSLKGTGNALEDLKGSGDLGEDIELFDLDELDRFLASQGALIDKAITDSNVESLFKGIDQAYQDFVNSSGGINEEIEKLIRKQEQLRAVANAVGQEVSTAFADFSGNMVSSLTQSGDAFKRFIGNLAKTVTRLIAIMLSQSLSQAIAGATASGTATGPLAVFSTPAFISTAISGVLAAFASIPKFASGGIAYGPTIGMFGEYLGARNNPEVVAPLDRLKDLIQPSAATEISLGLGTRIRGNDLELTLERIVEKKLRLR